MKTEQSAADIVFEKVLSKISTGEYPKGCRLPSENTLCSEFGVSRITIRSALQRLLALDLIETNIGGGTYVRDVSVSSAEFNAMIPFFALHSRDLWEMLEFRQGIEAMAAYYAAMRANAEDLEQLKQLSIQMAEHFQAKDVLAYSNLDYELHQYISHISHNSVIEKVTDILSRFFQKQIEESNVVIGYEVGYEEHKRIIQAIIIQKPHSAYFYASEHVENTIDRYKASPKIEELLNQN